MLKSPPALVTKNPRARRRAQLDVLSRRLEMELVKSISELSLMLEARLSLDAGDRVSAHVFATALTLLPGESVSSERLNDLEAQATFFFFDWKVILIFSRCF